jgi:hypothetical protein
MSKKDQNVLLNVIETDMLIETKVSKTRSKQMKNLKVFATTKNVDALNKMHSKDIRNVLAIAKLVHNIEDVS